jgi:hypothetical protein
MTNTAPTTPIVQYKQQANPLSSMHSYTPLVNGWNDKNKQLTANANAIARGRAGNLLIENMDGMTIMDVFKPQFQVQFKPRDMDSKASGVMGRQVKMNGAER